MTFDHINKIKGNISIHSDTKSSNLLDGTYKSIYKGKSLNFEDLREYVVGDNVRDIDWKASARSNNILVKQFIAEKKHNILFVLDSKVEMRASTSEYDIKSNVCMYSAGTIGYLAASNGDYVSGIFSKEKEICYFPFKQTLYHLESFLSSYEESLKSDNKVSLNELLDYIIKYINKRMIIFIITDLKGLEELDEKYIRSLSIQNDIMLINISDANLYADKSYDLDKNNYFSTVFLKNDKLKKMEKEAKEKKYEESKNKLLKYKVTMATINNQEEIVDKIIELLERHKYASTN